MKPCRNPDCGAHVAESSESGFCFTCLSDLHEELAKVLHLEAQFVQWCADHGQPNPHE